MNNIDKLIQELCPEGLRPVRLGTATTESTARNLGAEVDRVRSVTNTNGLVDTNKFWENSRTSADTSSYKVVKRGMFVYNPSRINVGSIARQTEIHKVIVSPMYVVFEVDETVLSPAYLMHFFSSSLGKNLIESSTEQGARFRLPFENLAKFMIQIPPLAVQQEIVSILDKFTELEAKLGAEVESRTSLFEALRAKLFKEASTVSKAELGSLCDMYSGDFVKKDRQGNDFVYPVYNGGSEPTGFYSEFNSPENSIVIASRGSIGSVSFVKTPFWAGNSCFVLRNLIKEVNYRYLYHYLKHSESELYKLRAVGTIPALNLRPLLKFEVPIPDLNHQERISSILDKFEQLESDIQFGLPAEIQARRKQYEYYRNKLLTFKELDAA